MKHYIFLLLSLVLTISSFSAMADDIPKEYFGKFVKKVPSCVNQQNETSCEKFHWDTIAVDKMSSEVAYVSIETDTINSHGCGFRGIGRWDGSKLISIGKPKNNVEKSGAYVSESTPWDECKISISVNDDTATYTVEEDTETYCHAAFCSARGWLGYPKGVTTKYTRKK